MSETLAWTTNLDALQSEIMSVVYDDNLEYPYAAQRVVAKRLGYDVEDVEFVDGPGDRGIDFWTASQDGINIYQVKTHKPLDDGSLNARNVFNGAGVHSLSQAYNFIATQDGTTGESRLHKLIDILDSNAKAHQLKRSTDPHNISFALILLGKGLTDQAKDDLAKLEKQMEKGFNYRGTAFSCHLELITVDDLLKEAWREQNYEWKDVNGKRNETIMLTPLRQSDRNSYLNDNHSAIFYCKASDLIQAYRDFGYQIFEPNVRANIRNSAVNNAIQASASHTRSMKEFRFLNNGLTVICTNFQPPARGRKHFRVTRPGIVNGLQTVMSLYSAYNKLSQYEKEQFDRNCYVLVRLLRHTAVNRITDVVRATNNQNAMQPRNLVSNSMEQAHFATFFPENLGWFYEAKQGAWNAFKQNHKTWLPQISKPPKNFKAIKGHKIVDNLTLAQDWLAFLGFANQAVNDRRALFDQEKRYYRLIFLRRPRDHAFETYESVSKSLKASINDSPDPHLMLVAHLSRKFVHDVVPSAQANRKTALARLDLKQDVSPAEESQRLHGDDEYVLNQILGSQATRLVFVDLLGYIFFKVFGEDTHRLGTILLQNHSWHDLKSTYDIATVKLRVEEENYDESDLLLVLWFIFKEAIGTVQALQWSSSYINSRNKTRFILDNRHQVFRQLLKYDVAFKKKRHISVYTSGFRDKEGIFDFVKRIIEEHKWSNV